MALQNLVSKWFLGLDHPATPSDTGGSMPTPIWYQYTNGTLFGSGVSYTDIRQGGVGDCWFVASLEEAVLLAPSVIQNMFIDNGNGTYTVRYFRGTVADYVTVDRYLPVSTNQWSSDFLIYAHSLGGYDRAPDANNKLWVALAEKAYAQVCAEGWNGRPGANAYGSLDGGWPGAPMSHITGVACYDHYVWSYTPVALGQYFNSGYMVTFCTQGSPPLSNVIGNHCYALLAWDAATDQFTLGNAWGFDYVDNHGVLVGEVTLSEAQLVSCVDDYAISSVAVNFIPVPVGLPMASASVSLVTKTANPNSLLPNLIPSRTEHTIPFGVDFKLVKGSAGDSGSFRDNGAVGSSPILDKVMTDWNRTQPTELDVHELSTHETWQLTSRMTSELAEEGLLPIDNRTWDGFSWDRVLTQKASEGEFLPNFR